MESTKKPENDGADISDSSALSSAPPSEHEEIPGSNNNVSKAHNDLSAVTDSFARPGESIGLTTSGSQHPEQMHQDLPQPVQPKESSVAKMVELVLQPYFYITREHASRLLNISFSPGTKGGGNVVLEIYGIVKQELDKAKMRGKSLRDIAANKKRYEVIQKIKARSDKINVTTHDGQKLKITVANVFRGMLWTEDLPEDWGKAVDRMLIQMTNQAIGPVRSARSKERETDDGFIGGKSGTGSHATQHTAYPVANVSIHGRFIECVRLDEQLDTIGDTYLTTDQFLLPPDLDDAHNDSLQSATMRLSFRKFCTLLADRPLSYVETNDRITWNHRGTEKHCNSETEFQAAVNIMLHQADTPQFFILPRMQTQYGEIESNLPTAGRGSRQHHANAFTDSACSRSGVH